jgi:hypothetical protein
VRWYACSTSVIWLASVTAVWSGLAILRTTPVLLGLFSLVTLFAHQLLQGREMPVPQAAWYSKALPTFCDTLAFVRHYLCLRAFLWTSPDEADGVKIPNALFSRLRACSDNPSSRAF